MAFAGFQLVVQPGQRNPIKRGMQKLLLSSTAEAELNSYRSVRVPNETAQRLDRDRPLMQHSISHAKSDPRLKSSRTAKSKKTPAYQIKAH